MLNHYCENLLTLDEFARLVGINPFQLHQLSSVDPADDDPIFDDDNRCDEVVYEYTWQNQDVSRDDIQRAINQAEYMFREEVGYWPAPRQECPSFVLKDSGCLHKATIPCKKLVAIGKYVTEKVIDELSLTVIEEDPYDVENLEPTSEFYIDVLYADLPDPDTPLNELRLVYKDETDTEDCFEWEVKPIKVTHIDENTFRISGKTYLIVKKELVIPPNPKALELTCEEHYQTEFTLYRTYIDETDTGSINCDNGCCSVCKEDFCATMINKRLGLIEMKIATYDTEKETWSCCGCGACKCCINKTADVNVICGCARRSNGLMDNRCAQIIAWLAASLIPCDMCVCPCSPLQWYRQPMLSKVNGKDAVFLTKKMQEEYKWGYLRGAVMAWDAIRNLRIISGGYAW